MGASYQKRLHEVADGVWAYLQPDGGWGWSNAGLVTGGEASLLVDTLFDLDLTGEMLAAMRRATAAAERIGTVVNTHANGDHWFGNALVSGSEIVASAAAAREMAELPPSRLAELMQAAPGLGEMGAFVRRIFGPFRFEGIQAALPNRTFDGELELRVGDRVVRLIEVGPAHTAGDVAVYLPAEGVLFAGDLLFHGGHPIVWAGPVANWIAACQRLEDLGATTVVPGHGPLATPAALAEQRRYFEYLTQEARARFDAGVAPLDAARDIDPGPYAGWGEAERLVVNVCALYRDFGADVDLGPGGPLGAMAAFAARGPSAS